MSHKKVVCFSCGHVMFFEHISRRDECEKCGADIRVCKNCQFYDPTAYNECREPQAEPIQDKERSHFCDYFEPASNQRGAQASSSKEELLAAAEALFKKDK
ncbi:MAG: hypothetical protein D6797_03815 [Bdellovibrio sp.]|nr:MAG: hypothetical protein D6797_03815 [Bdellovibrio sp.]